MKSEALRELLQRRPFQPFEVRMSNGDVYQVRYPDFAMALRSNFIIGDADADHFVIGAFDQMASVNVPQ